MREHVEEAGGAFDPTLEGDPASLAWQRALFEFNLFDMLSGHNNQPHIAAAPSDLCRRVSRLFNRLADGFCRRRTVLIRERQDDVAVLQRSVIRSWSEE